MHHDSLDHLEQFGYALLRGVFDVVSMCSLADQLSIAWHDRDDPSTLRSRGQVYGSRNLIETFPDVCALPRCGILKEFIRSVLGRHAGIVRVLYFDKPPDRSWSLPWHKDQTIAVVRNNLPSDCFRKPTVKAGVPHVEAPQSLLANMLTLRVHLDPMTEENGPLAVIPGSHRFDRSAEAAPIELRAGAGDVLAMRPLLTHSSSASRPGTTAHRRVVHFELAPCAVLPDAYEWFSFIPLNA